jgi:Ca-activated chloride channel family protein
MHTARRIIPFLIVCAAATSSARAAGTLAPAGAGYDPMRIVDHHVEVLIDNGFARTEVTQVFLNPNPDAVEAIYTLPLPDGAALSEITIRAGDRTLYGEVVLRDEAQSIYDMQAQSGGQAGLAVKQGYQRFEFRIAAIPAGEQATLSFAYYQALEIDSGIGRYLYPLEEGGTDDGFESFWNQNDRIEGEGAFRADITLRSAWPVEDVRLPDFEGSAEIRQDAPGEVAIAIAAQRNLDRDLVLYYRLPDDLPGRVELIPYRDGPEQPGTFMLVLTPGVDLAPLEHGRDQVFVLDVSGSMEGKIDTLKAAVKGALRSLAPGDRFRIVKFSDSAAELTSGWASAETESLQAAFAAVDALRLEGGTNLYAGLELALQGLDAERAAGVFLVTDAVANEGLVDGPSFSALLAERDVRVYGFLLGNSGNWALMQLISDVSGGFYAQVSNADDIAGQLLLARDKITHQALHGFEVQLSGGAVSELTHSQTKVHRGEQVVIFGRYAQPGPVELDVAATVTGKLQHYEGSFDLPERDTSNPELERLWAFAQVRWLEYQAQMELTDPARAAETIAALGVDYQLVTDETSMILLSDEDFARYGIDPNNRERTAREEEARTLRMAGDPVDHSVRVDDAFAGGAAPAGSASGSGQSSGWDSSGGGGGAVAPADAGLLGLLLVLALAGSARPRRRRS